MRHLSPNPARMRRTDPRPLAGRTGTNRFSHAGIITPLATAAPHRATMQRGRGESVTRPVSVATTQQIAPPRRHFGDPPLPLTLNELVGHARSRATALHGTL